jgi:hypothetical protein
MIRQQFDLVTNTLPEMVKLGQQKLEADAKYVSNPNNFDRKLEERSYLRFEFYESSKDAPHIRYLMFYENPDIRESRKAMHAKYQPISRNSTLLSYTGAESRQFSVSFRITLPHILATVNTVYLKSSNLQPKENLRKQFTNYGNFNTGFNDVEQQYSLSL